MTVGNAAERLERSPPLVGDEQVAAGLIGQAQRFGVRLEARLWADRPELLPNDLRAGLAVHRPTVLRLLAGEPVRSEFSRPSHGPTLDILPPVELVPPAWREGVASLNATRALDTIPPSRWQTLQNDAQRLLTDHGTELHRAAWTDLDLFGLHCRAPMNRSDCMGLAWLLNDRRVGTITPEAVGIVAPGGHQLHMRRLSAQARREAVLAWKMTELLK